MDELFTDWMKELRLNRRGRIVPSYENLRLIAANDPVIADRLRSHYRLTVSDAGQAPREAQP